MRARAKLPIVLALVLGAGLQPAFAAPANDDFLNATLIPSLPFGDVVDTADATTEPGEPGCYGTGATVWYHFVSPTTQLVVADTRGSTFDTVLNLYSGSGPFDLRLRRCADDEIGAQSLIAFEAQAGESYFFQAGGDFGDRGLLFFNLSLPGVLSGTVLDEIEQAPQSDICIDVFERDAKVHVATAFTDNDGEYRIEDLPPGDYKVHFKDCADRGPEFFGTKGMFLTQWFENRKTFRSADPVQVVGGLERSNIDADLRLRPRPDLAVGDVTFEDVKLQIGPVPSQELPALGYNRVVKVTAANNGPVSPRWSKVEAEVCPVTTGSCKSLGRKGVTLPPGASATAEFAWNGADMVGDVTVIVSVRANEDADWNDNVREIRHFVHVGGTGFGFGIECRILRSIFFFTECPQT